MHTEMVDKFMDRLVEVGILIEEGEPSPNAAAHEMILSILLGPDKTIEYRKQMQQAAGQAFRETAVAYFSSEEMERALEFMGTPEFHKVMDFVGLTLGNVNDRIREASEGPRAKCAEIIKILKEELHSSVGVGECPGCPNCQGTDDDSERSDLLH